MVKIIFSPRDRRASTWDVRTIFLFTYLSFCVLSVFLTYLPTNDDFGPFQVQLTYTGKLSWPYHVHVESTHAIRCSPIQEWRIYLYWLISRRIVVRQKWATYPVVKNRKWRIHKNTRLWFIDHVYTNSCCRIKHLALTGIETKWTIRNLIWERWLQNPCKQLACENDLRIVVLNPCNDGGDRRKPRKPSGGSRRRVANGVETMYTWWSTGVTRRGRGKFGDALVVIV